MAKRNRLEHLVAKVTTVQLDKTELVIRERGILDLLDISLRVIKRHWQPLCVTMLLGGVPLALINDWLIGWMINVEYSEAVANGNLMHVFLYPVHMACLVVIETPLAGAFATMFLGRAIFMEELGVRRIVKNVLVMWWPLLWYHVVGRGIVLVWLLYAAVPKYSNLSVFEILAFGFTACYCLLRALRPFANEIVLLERNPMRASDSTTMTISKRMSALHGMAGSDLFVRWMASAFLAFLLMNSLFGAIIFLTGAFLNAWVPSPTMLRIFLPLSMWTVAMFVTTSRFLNYLDLRIRQEGWEVELRLRAEASRLEVPNL
ncbi:MAG: hypothetical protein MK165_13285 [Pirellulaceae bacterium]|nr:hypothetical protein [Pirellulaceae bacterium]